MVALLVVLLIVVAVAFELHIARRGMPLMSDRAGVSAAMVQPRAPDSVFLTRGQTWVRMTTDGLMRVGVNDLVAQAIGDVTSVWIAAPGSKVRAGEPIMKLHVGDRDLVVAAPGDGTVEGFNERTVSAPWVVAQDPYRTGWLVSVLPDNYEATIAPLCMGATANVHLEKEMSRFVEFVAACRGERVTAKTALPVRGALAQLDDAAWRSFQKNFLGSVTEQSEESAVWAAAHPIAVRARS